MGSREHYETTIYSGDFNYLFAVIFFLSYVEFFCWLWMAQISYPCIHILIIWNHQSDPSFAIQTRQKASARGIARALSGFRQLENVSTRE